MVGEFFNMARTRQTIWRYISPLINRLRYSPIFNGKETDEIRRLTNRFKAATPIFVFQMGKVASTAIYRMLANSRYPGAILHAHQFDAFHPALAIRTFYRYYFEHRPRLKIISLVREPISRNVSAFFQNLRRDSGLQVANKDIEITELKKKFLKNYPHEIPLIWFDHNIKKHFGIDIYDYEFPSSGNIIISSESVELLVMRHDLPNELKTQLVSEFTNIENLCIGNENVGQDKIYSQWYEEFKSSRLPLSHLHYLAASKYMKHFFLPDMRQILMTWSEEPLPGSNVA